MNDAEVGSASRTHSRKGLVVLHTITRIIGWPICILFFLIAVASLQVLTGSAWLVGILLLLLAVALIIWRRRLRWFALMTLALLVIVGLWRSGRTPSQDRNWNEDVSVRPHTSLDSTIVTIENVRNFFCRSPTDYDASWETRSYDLDNLEGVEMILQPFPYSDLMAHTMLSFDFGPDGRVVLSIEARKEDGEPYGPVAGILNQFELIYLFIDERDAYAIRAHQGARIIAFPTRNDPLWRKSFFLSLCTTSNSLKRRPRFYNTLRDNCTTTWLSAVDQLSGNVIGVQLDTILNGRVGKLLHRMGAIDTNLSYEDALEHFRIDQHVLEHLDDPDFSRAIRRPAS